MSTNQTYTFYFGGELFSGKHLLGNALLAEAIFARSQGKYRAVLPQNLEQRDTTPHAIRDQDIRALLACDLGLFHYDGPELDSGTVVEFMFAKFADIPAVLVRTDFRNGGDQAGVGDPVESDEQLFPAHGQRRAGRDGPLSARAGRPVSRRVRHPRRAGKATAAAKPGKR